MPMYVLPYHFRLMRCLIRLKVKGDYRIRLTCADRIALVENLKLDVSKSYIVKILSEGDSMTTNLSQYVLNQLANSVGYADWNAFLRANPIPESKYKLLSRRRYKRVLNELVEQRITELHQGSSSANKDEEQPPGLLHARLK